MLYKASTTTSSASDWCALQEALYKFIDTIQYNTIQYHKSYKKGKTSQTCTIRPLQDVPKLSFLVHHCFSGGSSEGFLMGLLVVGCQWGEGSKRFGCWYSDRRDVIGDASQAAARVVAENVQG